MQEREERVMPRYVFVCGLHRSGTTVLADEIGRMENCAGFRNTGAIKDEGQFLQTVYEPDSAWGGAGRFGFDPRAHRTETSELLTSANIERLKREWNRHWDGSRPIRVEKTPSNLLMTRFLQRAFEGARFVAIKRHPMAVSLATQKWSRVPLHHLLEHWLHCQDIFDHDKAHLTHLHELRYEDYVEDPDRRLREVADFIGAEVPADMKARASKAHNAAYEERWDHLLHESPFKKYYQHIARKYEDRVARHGYSLMNWSVRRETEDSASARGSLTGMAISLGADLAAPMWRMTLFGEAKARELRSKFGAAK